MRQCKHCGDKFAEDEGRLGASGEFACMQCAGEHEDDNQKACAECGEISEEYAEEAVCPHCGYEGEEEEEEEDE